MSEQFLHGVEVVERADLTVSVPTVKSSVIGIVGTAPDALKAKTAKKTIKQEYCEISLTAVNSGSTGNLISLSIIESNKTSIEIDANNILILISNNDKQLMASSIKALLDKSEASAKINFEVKTDGLISKTLKPIFLNGGFDEPFPLNKPTLITNPSDIAKLGASGTLPDHLMAIFDQIGAMIVVVRVEMDKTLPLTISNVIGGVDKITGQNTGIYALKDAETITGAKPRLLIAPGFSDEISVASKFISIAKSLHAIAIVDAPSLNTEQAIKFRGNFGSDRLFIVEPEVNIFKNGITLSVSASSYVAGLIAKIDNEHGFWFSPSNHNINGITGTKRSIDFSLGDANCQANFLNEHDIATIIRKDGFRLWGNRTTSSDSRFSFLCVRRTADMINDSLQRAMLWAVDKPLCHNFVDSIIESVNAYLRHLKSIGAIVNGHAFVRAELNTPSQIEKGNITIDFDFSPMYPAEHITFQSILTNKYLSEEI